MKKRKRLSPDQVDALLYDLCVDLGFCLPKEDNLFLRSSPPKDVDEFANAVFKAERMNPEGNLLLYGKVRMKIIDHFSASDLRLKA